MSVAAAVVLRETYGRRDDGGHLIPAPPHLAALDQTARQLWELLANVADDDGMSWWALDALCARMGLTERPVQRATRRLEAAGVLTVTIGGGRGHTNLYAVAVSSCPQPRRPGQGFRRETPAPASTNPGASVHETPAPAPPEVPKEVPKEAGPPPPIEPWVLARYPALALRCSVDHVPPGATWDDGTYG